MASASWRILVWTTYQDSVVGDADGLAGEGVAGWADRIAHQQTFLHDGQAVVPAAQLMQCTGRQTKPVSGLLGGEEDGCRCRAISEHDVNERAVQRESQVLGRFIPCY